MDDQDPETYHRRSIRLKGYDYSQAGTYFLTICTYQRKCLFGVIVDGVMKLSNMGAVAQEEWLKTEELRQNVELDAFIVMPNHIHSILVISAVPGQDTAAPCPYNRFGRPIAGSLPIIVGAYKSAVSRRLNKALGVANKSVWQSNYYERIVRDEYELGVYANMSNTIVPIGDRTRTIQIAGSRETVGRARCIVPLHAGDEGYGGEDGKPVCLGAPAGAA